jgi:CRISPR-associated protein Csx16
MTGELEKNNRLVTFLGTGSYKETTYALGERRAETTRFVCRALAELLEPTEIVVLATKQAESTHGTALKDALGAGNFPSPKFELIPLGESPEQLWRQFDVIKSQLRGSAGPVTIDITHGFRSSPFFAAAVASFVRAVDENPPELRVCYAGALGTGADGVTPIWDLSEFVTLLDWTSALALFLRTGRVETAAAEAERIGRNIRQDWFKAGRVGPEPRLKELGESLRRFGGDLETLRTGDLLVGRGGNASSASLLFAAATAAGDEVAVHTPALADVLNRVAEMVGPLAGQRMDLSGADGRSAIMALAETYLHFGRYLEAASTIREGWVNQYAAKTALAPGAPQFHGEERDRAEWRAYKTDPVYREVTDRRNDLLHAQYRPSAQNADGMTRKVCELTDKFRDFLKSRDGSCFVNLTNHPSSQWEREQKDAALALAERIEDVRFPNVPPEASEKDLAAIAQAFVAQLSPNATHALVQGEFTLAFEIVRRLQERNITCLAATTERQVEEADKGRKTSTFRFVRFREYPAAGGRP